MDWQRRMIPQLVSGGLTASICVAVALTVLFAAPDARSQGVHPHTAPAAAAGSNPLSRWFARPAATPQAAAAQPPRQHVRKPRVSRSKKPTKPVAAQPAPAEEQSDSPQQQVAEPAWPNAAANVGGAMIAPLTVKTVREQLGPEPETLPVSENELSDIDRAAPPALAATATPEPAISTDGSGSTETDATVQAQVFAMGETLNAMIQSAWLEPLLLLVAGAIAAFSAVRLFA